MLLTLHKNIGKKPNQSFAYWGLSTYGTLVQSNQEVPALFHRIPQSLHFSMTKEYEEEFIEDF